MPRRRSLVVLAGALAAIAVGSAPARAQEPDASRLIEEGTALRERGDHEAALERFERAYAASRSARALAQVALEERALEHWVEAEEHLTQAMQEDDPWIARHRAMLERELREVAAHLGSLEVIGQEAGAAVRVNGAAVGSLPLAEPVRVVSGHVLVEASATDYEPFTRTVTMPPGGRATVEIALVARRGTTPHRGASEDPRADGSWVVRDHDDPGRSMRTIAWITLGASALALVTGIVAVALREGHASAFNSDDCLRDGRTRSENCGDELDAGHRAENVAIVGFSVSGAFGITGLVLWLVSQSASRDDDTDHSALALSCGPAGRHPGIVCSGAF